MSEALSIERVVKEQVWHSVGCVVKAQPASSSRNLYHMCDVRKTQQQVNQSKAKTAGRAPAGDTQGCGTAMAASFSPGPVYGYSALSTDILISKELISELTQVTWTPGYWSEGEKQQTLWLSRTRVEDRCVRHVYAIHDKYCKYCAWMSSKPSAGTEATGKSEEAGNWIRDYGLWTERII